MIDHTFSKLRHVVIAAAVLIAACKGDHAAGQTEAVAAERGAKTTSASNTGGSKQLTEDESESREVARTGRTVKISGATHSVEIPVSRLHPDYADNLLSGGDRDEYSRPTVATRENIKLPDGTRVDVGVNCFLDNNDEELKPSRDLMKEILDDARAERGVQEGGMPGSKFTALISADNRQAVMYLPEESVKTTVVSCISNFDDTYGCRVRTVKDGRYCSYSYDIVYVNDVDQVVGSVDRILMDYFDEEE